jgi:hypothetical protein
VEPYLPRRHRMTADTMTDLDHLKDVVNQLKDMHHYA